MSVFSIEVAGYTISVETVYQYSYTMCLPFVISSPTQFHIKICKEDIDFERAINSKETNNRNMTDAHYEFLALLRRISDFLIDCNVLLMHGVAFSVDNKAFVFTGKSGTGKTTHVFKWMKHRPDLKIINGDKPYIKIAAPPLVCPSPWTGKEGIYTKIQMPLSAIVIMERANDNVISQLSFSEALPLLLNSIYLPENPIQKCKVIKLIKMLDDNVQFYYFKVNNLKDDCVSVAYHMLFNVGHK